MTDEETPDPFAPARKEGIDRRSFVKSAVAAASVGALGVTGAGLVVPLSTAGGLKIRRFPYLGALKFEGPAPQGVPLIPLRVNEAGFVEGNVDFEVAEISGAETKSVLEWYAYCGHDQSPAFKPGHTQDNVLRYFTNPVKVKDAEAKLGYRLWYADKLGQQIRPEDFPNVGDGAPFKWRSEGLEGNDIVTGIIIRLPRDLIKGEDASAFMAGDLIAFSSYCAHFCCVPGYKESDIPLKAGAGYFDRIYCTCHDSVYDPREIKKYKFPPNM